MKHSNACTSRLRFGLAQLVMLVSVAACGGGGGANSPQASPQALPQTSTTAYASLAEPAGNLCEKRETSSELGVEYCIEPTSSSIGVQELWAELRKPNGPFVKLTVTGVDMRSQALMPFEYIGLSARNYYSGQGTLVQGGDTYQSVSPPYLFPGQYAYAGPDGKAFYLDGLSSNNFGNTLTANWTRISGDPSVPETIVLESWYSMFGLLTDWHDAPQDTNLVFTGIIGITSGDGLYDENVKAQHQSHAGCSITMEMDLLTGNIRSQQPVVECVDSDTGASFVMDINSLQLNSRGSRVRALGSGSVSYNDPKRAVFFEGDPLNNASGGIYGPGANDLYIQGVFKDGYFIVYARRDAVVQ